MSGATPEVNLRAFRLRAMLTQEELALKAGVGVRTIRDIESGRVRPQPRTLRLLCKALNLDERGRALLIGSAGNAGTVPRELPRALPGFAGREEHLGSVLTAVDEGAAVVAVHGMAGVGKTALAVRIAHELAPRYPDGQLFVDLRGYTDPAGSRPDLVSVLTRALGSLNVDERDVPADPSELAAYYRSTIADRSVLLVFDNASDAEQVEALLPGTASSLVLTTSRRDLSRLAGAFSVPLEPPPMPEAVAMLGAAAGRITADGAVSVAERCGRLPLALGLAAARLRSRPQWRVEDLLARLDHEDRLLDELDMGHRGVAAALRTSYLELDAAHRRLLRRLSLVPGDDVDAHAAAALCAVDEERASAMLESLVEVHLVETRAPGRYRMHDLVRLFATRLAELEETEDDRNAALARMLEVYLHFAYQAASHITSPFQEHFTEEAAAHDAGLPGFVDHEGAVAWFEAERGNLAAAVRAASAGPAWHLATAFSAFRMHDRDSELHLAINQTALNLARDLGDERKEARSLGDRGRQLAFAGRRDEAIDCLERSAVVTRRLGDTGAATWALRNVGLMHRQSGRFTDALGVYHEALILAEAISDATAIVHINLNMVVPLLHLGRLAEAEQCIVEAERLMDVDDVYNRSRIENFRGVFVREHGDPAAALVLHSACLERCRQRGIREGLTPVLVELGEDLLHLGRGAEAVAHLQQAVEYAEELAYPALERMARNSLGRALTATGDPDAALGHHQRAASLAESHEDAYELARAHHGLAVAHRDLGASSAAERHLRHAARGFEDCGTPEAALVAKELDRITQR
ncbi:tetratricopeptide repeat protein [Glycomyces sp. NPDC049804]|uniref:tetratricopeptide repeat protein n=1 Tax=Glycomyces sp. NPDC049804 TaxID=3154363 RepID=UPI0034286D5D